MVREEDESTNPHLMQPGRAGQDADHGGVELRRRAQEQPALDGPAGDLDQGALRRHKAQRTSHTLMDVIDSPDLSPHGWHLKREKEAEAVGSGESESRLPNRGLFVETSG